MSLESLEVDVAVKLAFVDKSLTKVDEYRKQLQENARKVKEDIHGAVDRQVGSLRGRERQLIRQVEVVTAHQNCLLSTQQAGLMHSQGALTATKNLLNQCSTADVSTLSKIKMDDLVCTKNVRPVNLVSVQLKEMSLSTAIGAFGSVQLPEAITHHPSPVIPAKVEEYEDEDHDVLHKSVAGAASGPDSPMRVTVQFPRLAHQNWLIGRKEGIRMMDTSAKIQYIGESKCNVTSWLSNLQLTGSQDEEDNAPTPSSIGSFDLMSAPVLSSNSSSIEIVPFNFDSDKEDCSTTGFACEIENVPSCLEDKSRWLSPRHKPSLNSALQQIRVADACQANEPCSDFSECVCKGECADYALQKAKQSAAFQEKVRSRKRTISEVYGSNPILSHMADILSSENSQWLMKRGASHSYVPGLAKKIMYEAPGEKWLASTRPSSVAISPHSSRVVLSTHSNIWLLHKLKAEKSKLNEENKELVIDEDVSKQQSTFELTEKLKKIVIQHSGPENTTHTIPFYHVSNDGRDRVSRFLDNKFTEENTLSEKASSKRPWLVRPSMSSVSGKNIEKVSPAPPTELTLPRPQLDSWLWQRL